MESQQNRTLTPKKKVDSRYEFPDAYVSFNPATFDDASWTYKQLAKLCCSLQVKVEIVEESKIPPEHMAARRQQLINALHAWHKTDMRPQANRRKGTANFSLLQIDIPLHSPEPGKPAPKTLTQVSPRMLTPLKAKSKKNPDGSPISILRRVGMTPTRLNLDDTDDIIATNTNMNMSLSSSLSNTTTTINDNNSNIVKPPSSPGRNIQFSIFNSTKIIPPKERVFDTWLREAGIDPDLDSDDDEMLRLQQQQRREQEYAMMMQAAQQQRQATLEAEMQAEADRAHSERAQAAAAAASTPVVVNTQKQTSKTPEQSIHTPSSTIAPEDDDDIESQSHQQRSRLASTRSSIGPMRRSKEQQQQNDDDDETDDTDDDGQYDDDYTCTTTELVPITATSDTSTVHDDEAFYDPLDHDDIPSTPQKPTQPQKQQRQHTTNNKSTVEEMLLEMDNRVKIGTQSQATPTRLSSTTTTTPSLSSSSSSSSTVSSSTRSSQNRLERSIASTPISNNTNNRVAFASTNSNAVAQQQTEIQKKSTIQGKGGAQQRPITPTRITRSMTAASQRSTDNDQQLISSMRDLRI